ncbi:hypothetical protein CCR75_006273 [Bremia lactucae]|uniref:Uncharacterized protein n=1 Tax=Bremia lactucae TaxID=4779 RepID=A0A976FFN6_BRELC|nr:hypothetical protein CCR75_006273 [Bremia lactucae]
MGAGTVTLLEINNVPNQTRIACCLPSGEFVFVADTCAPELGATNAADLYGGNLFQYLVQSDAENLEKFLQRADYSMSHMHALEQKHIMVRLINKPNIQLHIQLSTAPLTLRMKRCIDTIQSLSSSFNLFADSSSFVLSQDEFRSVLKTPLESDESPHLFAPLPTEDDDELVFLKTENGCFSPTCLTCVVPLELKHRHSSFEDSGTEETDDDLRKSLSNLAFEADWTSEACS